VTALRSARRRRAGRAIGTLLGGACCVAGAAGAAAQTAHQLQLEVAGSHARPPAGVVADPATYITGALHWLRAGGMTAFAGVGAGAAAAQDADGWVSGYGGVLLERSLNPGLAAGLTASAVAFRLDRTDAYRVAAVRIEPELRVGTDAQHLTARLHGGLGGVRSRPVDQDTSALLWAAGGALLLERAVGRTRVRAGAAAAATRTGTFLSGGGAVEAWVGGARAHLEARIWYVPDAGTVGTMQLRVDVPLTRVLRAAAAGGRSDPDPLLGTPASAYASAGISWDVLATVAPPPPASIELLPGAGTVRFTVAPGEDGSAGTRAEGDAISVVELIGDFSAWRPVPLREIEPGRWRVELPVAPGVYHFVFRVDGELWLPADAPGRTQDEWGRPTATLVVPDA
jgi:hypothetical protein